jgi:hypothetical protein
VAAGAGVACEDDIRALVYGEAVILVFDNAAADGSVTLFRKHTKSCAPHLFWIVRSCVLQSKPSVLCPAAKPLLALFALSPSAARGSKADDRTPRDGGLTVIDDEIGHDQGRRVRHAVASRRGVENTDVL